jgi:flagellar export protein FliJ
VKAFTFRLEQVLRWRETEKSLQEARVATAAAALAKIQSWLEKVRAELAGARIDDNPDGSALRAYAAFRDHARARIHHLEGQARAAKRTVDLEMNCLVEADRKMTLIDNLRQRARTAWTREFDRELSTFADEAFLNRYNR